MFVACWAHGGRRGGVGLLLGEGDEGEVLKEDMSIGRGGRLRVGCC